MEASLVLLYNTHASYYGDEAHFVPTIHQFVTGINLNTLKHYDEMSTPLPFVLYALWGRVFGLDLPNLRLFSMVIAFATYLLFYWLLLLVFNDTRYAFWGSVFLAANPYMIGLSFFVYTDMLPIFFILLGCVAMLRRQPLVLALASCGALLCRQYFIFFPGTVLLGYSLEYLLTRERSARLMVLAAVASFLPWAALALLWGGIAPDNAMRASYLGKGLRFHPSYLVLYILQCFVYLFPVVFWRWRFFYSDFRVLGGCFLLSWVYWLFPVAPSEAIVKSQIYTVGFFQNLLGQLTDSARLEQVVFFVTFLLGLPIVFAYLRDGYMKFRQRDFGFPFLLDLSIITFLATMPFSYHCWEKYFLPLVPLSAIRILLFPPNALKVQK
jgi:hypothetical protein